MPDANPGANGAERPPEDREEALERVRRYAQELEALNEIGRIATEGLDLRPMLQRITDALQNRFRWEFVAVALVDPVRGMFVCEALSSRIPSEAFVGYARPLSEGVVGEVASTGRAVVLDDVRRHPGYVEIVPGVRSEMCVPLVYRGEMLGVLNLESRMPSAFRGQLPLLRTVAEQMAGAVASARLIDEVRRRAGHLQMLSEISRSALEAESLEDLLDRVVSFVRDRFSLELVAFLRLDASGTFLTETAYSGRLPSPLGRGEEWPLQKGIIGRAARENRPQLVLDTPSDPSYVVLSEDVRAELAVPVRFRGLLLGILNMESRSPDTFSPETGAVLETIADQVAGAIHMAAVNERLTETNRRLEEAQDRVARLVDSTPQAFESLAAWSRPVAAELARSIGSSAIGIWQLEGGQLVPLGQETGRPPSDAELRELSAGRAIVDAEDATIVAVHGLSGELCGSLVLAGTRALSDAERRLVSTFSRQLGGSLEMQRVRRQLWAAEARRASSLKELHDQGVATVQICPTCGTCYDHTVPVCLRDASQLDSSRLLPYLLLDRYRFIRQLGEGGMGTVYLAHDEKLGRDVALKVIRPDHFNNPEMRSRFEREARAVAKIQHPGVIALYDSGELEDGSAFLVMEYLTGRDLAQLVADFGPGRPTQVGALLRQGAAALDAAHRAGIIHRDIKPENIFLVDDGGGLAVKIFDFGLSRPITFDRSVTQFGLVVGTPGYMSPEQASGRPIDARSDLYSFAVVAFEALTARRAVAGDDVPTVMANVLRDEPPSLSQLVPGFSRELDRAFARAFAKDPAARPVSVGAWVDSFVDRLEALPALCPGWPARLKGRRALLGRPSDV